MDHIVIEADDTYFGYLRVIEYIPVSGSHVKADHFYVTYRLVLNGSEVPGSFTERFIIHQKTIYIQKVEIEETELSEGLLKKSSLLAIDLVSGKIKQSLSELKRGVIRPVRIESSKIIYTKQEVGSRYIRHFERDL